jgi:pimeloyl-ACP methyl ester carboxylesterase
MTGALASSRPAIRRARTSVLEVAYEDSGPADGAPVFLMHGFPYDPRAYDGVVPLLVAEGCRTIVPYLRGYGPTRFLSPDTPRSGQQAALGNDLRELMDALGIERAFLCGYDWGGRACCIVSALWPERVRGLVSGGGYNVHDVAGSARPADAAHEHRAWYQYYFCTPRGIAGLSERRRDIAALLWRLWRVDEPFDAALFEQTAASFDNPDFVGVVIHSYRVRFGYVAGDPSLEPIEARLAMKPPIGVPTIVLHGEADGIALPSASEGDARRFTGPYGRRLVPHAGHALPQDAPRAVADAVLQLVRAERG